MIFLSMLIGAVLGYSAGYGVAALVWQAKLCEQDRLIEAIRHECGAPDPDQQ